MPQLGLLPIKAWKSKEGERQKGSASRAQVLCTGHDVIECTRVVIDQGVQEPKQALASSDELIVEECDDACKDRACAAHPGHWANLTAIHNEDILG